MFRATSTAKTTANVITALSAMSEHVAVLSARSTFPATSAGRTITRIAPNVTCGGEHVKKAAMIYPGRTAGSAGTVNRFTGTANPHATTATAHRDVNIVQRTSLKNPFAMLTTTKCTATNVLPNVKGDATRKLYPGYVSVWKRSIKIRNVAWLGRSGNVLVQCAPARKMPFADLMVLPTRPSVYWKEQIANLINLFWFEILENVRVRPKTMWSRNAVNVDLVAHVLMANVAAILSVASMTCQYAQLMGKRTKINVTFCWRPVKISSICKFATKATVIVSLRPF